MSALTLPVRAGSELTTPGVTTSGIVGAGVAMLETIFDDGISVAAWRRGPVPEIVAALDRALPNEEIVVRESLRASDPELGKVIDVLGPIAGPPTAGWLRELAELYAVLADADRLGLRLCVTRGQPCPRFHVDRVGLRLICTLRGPGTQWLDHADVERRYLGVPGSTDAPYLLRPGAVVRGLDPFDVGIFKGESWPGNAGRGAVHRSPPPDGGWRLLASFDSL
jgi:Protein of unknown function (DUF1826)